MVENKYATEAENERIEIFNELFTEYIVLMEGSAEYDRSDNCPCDTV